MVVNLQSLTNSLGKLTDLVADDKQVIGVLFMTDKNQLKLCFHNAKKALVDNVEVLSSEDGDFNGVFMVDYTELKTAIDNFQPSGNIKADAIKFEYDNKAVTLSVDTYGEFEDGDGDLERRYYSTKTRALAMTVVTSETTDIKAKMLMRCDYNYLANPTDEVPDIWDVKELTAMLNNVQAEKNRTIYVAPSTRTAFVSNTLALIETPFKNESIKRPLSLSSSTAKSLIGVLGKMEDNGQVNIVTKDNRYCYVFDGCGTGIWFELSASNQIHISTMSEYHSKEFTKYQMVFMREFLNDSLKTAITVANMDKSILSFVKNKNGELCMKIQNQVGSNGKDNFEVIIDDCYAKDNDILEQHFIVNPKLIQSVVNSIKSQHCYMDIDVSENGVKALRIAEVDYDNLIEENLSARQSLGLAEGEPLPADVKASYRSKTLGTRAYMML